MERSGRGVEPPPEVGGRVSGGGARDVFCGMRHAAMCRVGALYMLMGRELSPLQTVPAGNVCGLCLIHYPIHYRTTVTQITTSAVCVTCVGFILKYISEGLVFLSKLIGAVW